MTRKQRIGSTLNSLAALAIQGTGNDVQPGVQGKRRQDNGFKGVVFRKAGQVSSPAASSDFSNLMEIFGGFFDLETIKAIFSACDDSFERTLDQLEAMAAPGECRPPVIFMSRLPHCYLKVTILLLLCEAPRE